MTCVAGEASRGRPPSPPRQCECVCACWCGSVGRRDPRRPLAPASSAATSCPGRCLPGSGTWAPGHPLIGVRGAGAARGEAQPARRATMAR